MTGNFRDKIQPLVNQLLDACAEADLDCVTVIRPDPYEGHDGQSLHAINLDVTMKGNVDNGRPNLRLSRSYMNVGDKPFTLNMPPRGGAERLSVGGVNKKDSDMNSIDGPMYAMSFSQALSLAANESARITRPFWSSNGELVWVGILRAECIGAVSPHVTSYAVWHVAAMPDTRPDIGDSGMLFYMAEQTMHKTTDRDAAPIVYHRTNVTLGWKPSADDMLAVDWTIIDNGMAE